MKLGGTGGNKTKSGLIFEEKTDLKKTLLDNGFTINFNKVFYEKKFLGIIFSKNSFYKDILEKNNIDWKKISSKKILPDDGIYLKSKKKIIIIEKKFQKVEGSVDEKLQTCDFKLKKYKKLCASLKNINVEYIYVLNEWFKKEKYNEVLLYIESVGCKYYFKQIPMSIII